jgi:hypothetical protein
MYGDQRSEEHDNPMNEPPQNVVGMAKSGASSSGRSRVPSDMLKKGKGEYGPVHIEDAYADETNYRQILGTALLLDGDNGGTANPTLGASELKDQRETSLTTQRSFEGFVPVEDHFLASTQPYVPVSDRTISVKMVVRHSGNNDDGSDCSDNEMEPFKPPRLSTPQVITFQNRCATPPSWQASMRPLSPVGGVHRRFPSAPVSPITTMSKLSLRKTRSEVHFHVYESDAKSSGRAVPPFIVVHNTGHAMVKITPKGDHVPEYFNDEDHQSTTSSLLTWRSCLRPIVMLIAVGMLILASITVAAGLIKSKQGKSNTSVGTTPASLVAINTGFPTAEPFVSPGTGADDAVDVVGKAPDEESNVPTPPTTRPSRTPPSSNGIESSSFSPSIESSTSLHSQVPTSDEDVPWNNYIIGLLAVESPDTFENLDDPENPQYKALKWLSIEMSQEGADSYNQDSGLQLFGLLCFWYATDGMNWNEDGGWLTSGTNECDWEGVICDSNNIVIALDLIENGLTGYIPPEIQLLKNLQAMVLSRNFIGGSLPLSLMNVTELVDLNLSNNSLVGPLPEQFGSFDLLKTFDVSQNSLTGTIPSTIGNFLNLEVLNLCANELSGSIPRQIGSLSFLRSINLGGNEELSGVFPDAICDTLRSAVSRGYLVLDVVVDCSVECECCTQCCSNSQSRAMESCCTL